MWRATVATHLARPLGLAFTLVGIVATFATDDPVWWLAWLLPVGFVLLVGSVIGWDIAVVAYLAPGILILLAVGQASEIPLTRALLNGLWIVALWPWAIFSIIHMEGRGSPPDDPRGGPEASPRRVDRARRSRPLVAPATTAVSNSGSAARTRASTAASCSASVRSRPSSHHAASASPSRARHATISPGMGRVIRPASPAAARFHRRRPLHARRHYPTRSGLRKRRTPAQGSPASQ